MPSSRVTGCQAWTELVRGPRRGYDQSEMVGDSATYVLAVRRGLRETVPANWLTRVCQLPGVSAASTVSPHRIQIEADQGAIARIRADFGVFLRIEPLEERTPFG